MRMNELPVSAISTHVNGHTSKMTTDNTSTILDPDRIYAKLLETGNDWADKHAAASFLEETKKSVLSKVMNAQVDAKSVAAAETLALCNPEYRGHIKDMVEARRVADRARVAYDSIKALMELRRSQESTRRAETMVR